MKTPTLFTMLLLLVTLTSLAAADTIVPQYVKDAVRNARYYEQIKDARGYPHPSNLWEGTDDQAAEREVYTQTTTYNGDARSTAIGTAEAKAKGPAAAASVRANSSITGSPGYQVGRGFDMESSVRNEFTVAVWPKFGGHPAYPKALLLITGDYLAVAQGNTSPTQTLPVASAWLYVKDRSGNELASAGTYVCAPGDGFSQDDKNFVLSIWVPMIKDSSGDYYNWIELNQSASARAYTTVGPYESFWSEACAMIDPQVCIDPDWEHADDFALYFSPGMEPLAEPLVDPAVLAECNFESQSIAPFSTDYIQGLTPSPTPGHYNIAADPSTFGLSDWGGSDHTTGSGSFMIVDGSENSDDRVVYIEIDAVAGARYELSGAVQNILDGSQGTNSPELSFRVDGVELDTDSPLGFQVWNSFRFYYDAQTSGLVTLAIHDNNTEPGGNDFGLDDLALSTSVPEPATLVLAALGLLSLGFGGWRRMQ